MTVPPRLRSGQRRLASSAPCRAQWAARSQGSASGLATPYGHSSRCLQQAPPHDPACLHSPNEALTLKQARSGCFLKIADTYCNSQQEALLWSEGEGHCCSQEGSTWVLPRHLHAWPCTCAATSPHRTDAQRRPVLAGTLGMHCPRPASCCRPAEKAGGWGGDERLGQPTLSDAAATTGRALPGSLSMLNGLSAS